jgi:DNA-binding transcriptional MerR regulator
MIDDLRSTAGPVQLVDPEPGVCYSLERVVHLTGVSRRSILLYCKSGLVRPRQDPNYEPITFDEEAIYTIRRVEDLRSAHGINLAGIRMNFQLAEEMKRLREEMRFLRS